MNFSTAKSYVLNRHARHLVCGIVVGVIGLASITHTPAAFANDNVAALVCNNVKGDDKYRLRKLLKENRLKMKKIYPLIKCDGQSLLQYALSANSVKTGVFIVKRLSSKLIKENALIEWAAENGHGESEITAAMKKRVGQ